MSLETQPWETPLVENLKVLKEDKLKQILSSNKHITIAITGISIKPTGTYGFVLSTHDDIMAKGESIISGLNSDSFRAEPWAILATLVTLQKLTLRYFIHTSSSIELQILEELELWPSGPDTELVTSHQDNSIVDQVPS